MNFKPLYGIHGLMFQDEAQIELREHYIRIIKMQLMQSIQNINKSFSFTRCEAPILTPASLLNSQYTEDDVFFTSAKDLVMRPETTIGSYEYGKALLQSGVIKLPVCVWQSGKSFRKEEKASSQSYGHMRFKEFYQLEFQCLYNAQTSKADYYNPIVESMCEILVSLTGLETRIVPSDRLPSYSTETQDVEVRTDLKWLEVASISRRQDFMMRTSESVIGNTEVAIGLDRLVYLG